MKILDYLLNWLAYTSICCAGIGGGMYFLDALAQSSELFYLPVIYLAVSIIIGAWLAKN